MTPNLRSRLGRRHAPDQRDHAYPLRALLDQQRLEDRPYRYWSANRVVLDQGDTPECVAFSWAHFLIDAPTTHKLSDLDALMRPDGFTQTLYDEAQQHDEFDDTPPAGGTSVRAGAKVLQGWGLIQNYHWASSIDDVVDAVLHLGPVIVGTNWLENMFQPQWDGHRYVLDVTGPSAGGHAWKVDGVNKATGWARMKNSWGRSWANQGHAYLHLADLERLINDDGEAAIATE
jgi:hypothetical protein